MAFSKGRNELQASIEDSAIMLESLAMDIDSYYGCKISNIKEHLDKIVKDKLDEIQYVTNIKNHEICVYKEFLRVAYEMLLVEVYSYAEKHFEELISRLSYNRKQAIREYSRDIQTSKGVSDIEKYFYILKKHKELSIDGISEIWIDYKEFHSLRNDIVHRRICNHPIDIDYINSNLTQISKLLLIIEEETR